MSNTEKATSVKEFFENIGTTYFPKNEAGESTLTANQAIDNWVALSSGSGENGVSQVPGALLDLLAAFGKLAENLAALVGLVA